MTIGLVNADTLGGVNIDLDIEDLIQFEPDREREEMPRYAQSISWNRNWTVMSTAEVVDHTDNPDVSAQDDAFVKRKDEAYREEAAEVLQRHKGAVDGDVEYGVIEGFFTTREGVEDAARKMLVG